MAADRNERTFREGWFGDGWEYTFRVEQPVNIDGHQLMVLRWRGTYGEEDFEQEYLCREGWIGYSEMEVHRDPIIVTGLRHFDDQKITSLVLDAMVMAMNPAARAR